MSGYTPLGVFVNGSSPGLSASLFNGLESWIQQAEGDTGAVVLNGSTTGTATLYQCFQGTFKLVIVQLSNFRNGSAPAQTIALPVPFTVACRGWNSQLNSFQLLKAGVAQTVLQLVTFNTAADNGVNGQTTLKANWLWHCDTFIDTISFNGSQASGVGGQLIMVGI